MSDQPNIREALLAEFEQAWTHHRHVENMRTQYLGFFFTVALGSTALAVPAVTVDSLNDPSRLLTLAAFLWVFSVVTSFILIGVRKAGPVLAHYADAMTVVRQRWYSSEDPDLATLFDVRTSLARSSRSRILSVQWSAEWAIRSVHVVATILLVLLAVQAARLPASSWLVMAIVVAACSSLVLVVGIMLLASRAASSQAVWPDGSVQARVHTAPEV